MFYEQLCKACEEKGIKLTPFIQNLGLSKGNIARWKNGAVPSGNILTRIAENLDCSVDYLLGKSDGNKQKKISNAEASEILKRKFIEYGIIKEGEDISEDQLDDYLKKLSTIIKSSKD